MPLHIETPLLTSIPLSKSLNCPVYLKMEALQPAGSFKIRGIGLACQRAVERGVDHFIIASGGNAGLAVAYAGEQLGCRVTVVVPKTTKLMMRQKIAFYGAHIIVHGNCWDDAFIKAQSLIDSPKKTLIHPFDHPDLWEGHATMIDEIVPLIPKPGLVVLATGGGGLLCGVAAGLHRNGWADVPLLSVEPEGAPTLYQSIKKNKLCTLDTVTTIATSLATKVVAKEAFEWTRKHKIIPWLVSDEAALKACHQFAEDQRVLVEPSCGAALSTLYNTASPVKNKDSLLVIVCGGNIVSLEMMAEWGKIKTK